MTAGARVAAWALETSGTVPEHRARRARTLVADSLAVSLAAGARSPVARRAVAAAASGSLGPCRVLGADLRLPPVQAAFANSALAHALDFDDTHDLARLHTTTVVLPAALAAAEADRAPGAAVVDALVVASELMCVLGLAARSAPGNRAASWYLTQLVGGVGAAVAAGLVLGLDADALASAVGHAAGQASGAKESSRTGDARAVYTGHAAAQGVLAALLAREGVEGPVTGLDGDLGLWPTHLGVPGPDLARLPGGDGAWEFDAVVVKPWPGCRITHPFLDAVLALPAPVLADPEGIGGVVVAVDPTAARLCRPARERRRPRTVAEAGFSVPFMVALALARGGVGPRDMTEEALTDPRVLRVADLVVEEHRPEGGPGYAPARVEAVHRGRSYSASGAPGPVLSERGEADKFSACLEHAGLGGAEPGLREAVGALASGPARDFTAAVRAHTRPIHHPARPQEP